MLLQVVANGFTERCLCDCGDVRGAWRRHVPGARQHDTRRGARLTVPNRTVRQWQIEDHAFGQGRYKVSTANQNMRL